MKLAILPSWYPETKKPNSGIFIYNQAHDLADKISANVIVLRKGWPSKTIHNDGSLTTYTKTYIGIPNTNIKRLDNWSNVYFEFFCKQNDINHYDIIHAHDHLAGYAALNIHQKKGIPYILTLHNTNFITRTIPVWKLPYIKKVIEHAAQVIVVGQKLFDTIQEDYQPDNLLLIPNYVDTAKFTLRPQLPSTPFSFLTVTSLFHKKRIDKMIEAFGQVASKANAELHIIGEGEDRRKLEKLTKSLQLTTQIKFHGIIQNSDLTPFYHKCHAYLSTSSVETFGISIIEAMSCGLPVVCTTSGGPEYIVDESSGIISSLENFEDSMLSIINNFDQYNSGSIRAIVERNYSKEVVIPQIINVYKTAIS